MRMRRRPRVFSTAVWRGGRIGTGGTSPPPALSGGPASLAERVFACCCLSCWLIARSSLWWSLREMIRTTAIRLAGYALSCTLAWVFYVGWIAAESPGPRSLQSSLFAALFFCVFGGFSAALVLMALPWALVVFIFSKVRLPGAAYFPCAGALLMILLGCAISSLSPKPLFIEDQTFFEGALITLERQGVCLCPRGPHHRIRVLVPGRKNVGA